VEPDCGGSPDVAVSHVRIEPDELRTLFLFAELSEEQLAWIVERGELRTYDAGAAVFREGEPAQSLYVLVDGRLRMSKLVNGEQLVLNETSHRGAYTGATRAYADGAADEPYPATVVAVQPSRFFTLPAADFDTLMRRWFPLARHLLDGLYVGVRNSESDVRQREHLAQLGTLSANLAHELNNPAAAAVRATGQLRARVAGMRHKLAMIADGQVDRTQIRRLVALQEDAVERAAKPREPLTPVQEADREDELADRLADLGVPGGYDLAPVLVQAGIEVAWVDAVAAGAGDTLEGALRWLSYTLETEALMDEIEEATSRISTLVASVKQYSSMDTASVQDVDVHAGLDATVVMLGHKLQGVEVVRDYDRSLPRISAHAAELNQVWTNLIDNAAYAMAGRGRLLLRTSLAGDRVLVEVGDDGPGIAPEVQPRVFDAFFTTKAPGEGSGLGLDNSRRIVTRRHSGDIDVVTGPEGTTFRVQLPLAQDLR
jgi:signal transduction histidine kinase